MLISNYGGYIYNIDNNYLCFYDKNVVISQKLFQYKIVVPLRYFPAGPIKKEYALFTHGIADSDEALFTYVKVGIEYVLKLAKS